LDVVAEDIEKWRHRLYDVSWFMRNLNESIARQANQSILAGIYILLVRQILIKMRNL
jgi:hypothetical protein